MAGSQDLLLEAVSEIRSRVNELHASSAVAERRMDDLHDGMTKIARTLHGDSEPERGVFHRVVNLERQVGEITATRKAVSGWAWAAVGAAILASISAWWQTATKDAISAWWRSATKGH